MPLLYIMGLYFVVRVLSIRRNITSSGEIETTLRGRCITEAVLKSHGASEYVSAHAAT